MADNHNDTDQPQKKRCAIYSRTSVDSNSSDSFGSANAQFTACADYIGSQIAHHWQLVDMLYEDRGYSGGDLRRPGLQSLLADIQRGLIDVVVVHRLDRLTRSLPDLQVITEVLEAHNVALASVTQAINTSDHSGRLAIHLLTTFSEFERELIGERVKEKRAETLKKGLWQGLSAPLGYAVQDARLVAIPDERALVIEIFTRYANGASVTELYKELNDRGLRKKQWHTRTGKLKGGKPYDRNTIYVLLKNRVYLGEVFYEEAWLKSAHEPIISQDLWDQVQELLHTRSRREHGKRPTLQNDACFALKGRLFGSDGRAMSPWLSSKHKGRKYAYYIPQREIAEGAGASDLPRLPAAEVDHNVWLQLRRILADPSELIDHLPKTLIEDPAFDASLIIEKFKSLEAKADDLFPLNQRAILLRLVKRVTIHTDLLNIQLNMDGLMDLILELLEDQPELVAIYRQRYAAPKR